MRSVLVAMALGASSVGVAQAQGVPPPAAASDDVGPAIDALRNDMVDAFNKGDVDRLLSHLTPDAIVTWQNGEVSHGTNEVRAYNSKMMSGPDRVVKSISASPVVEGRRVHDDWAFSWGHMNDTFSLMDGRELTLDSRFSAVLVRADGGWKVSEFHLSTDAFHGAIIKSAIMTTAKRIGLIGGSAALIAGVAIGFGLGRRRTAKP